MAVIEELQPLTSRISPAERHINSIQAISESINGNMHNALRIPLLVWIDDHMSNNCAEIWYAKQWGINVIELESTALAKAWIEANDGRFP